MRNKRVRRARSAVALSYDGKGAPSISAKGKGEIADRIGKGGEQLIPLEVELF